MRSKYPFVHIFQLIPQTSVLSELCAVCNPYNHSYCLCKCCNNVSILYPILLIHSEMFQSTHQYSMQVCMYLTYVSVQETFYICIWYKFWSIGVFVCLMYMNMYTFLAVRIFVYKTEVCVLLSFILTRPHWSS